MTPGNSSITAEEGKIALNVIIISGITLMLFWLPLAGPFTAGFIQSRKIRNTGVFLFTAGVSGLVIGFLFFFLGQHMTALPVVGAIARKGPLFFSLSFAIPLLAGCFIGFSHGK